MEVAFKPLDGFQGDLSYAHEGDAGIDLRSAERLVLQPLSRATVRCGFAVAIPEGFAGLVIPRSGLAARRGVTGLVDSGYRGEVKVVLHNTDATEAFEIEAGDRIAQLAIVETPRIRLVAQDELDETDRGADGFGSSGVA